MTDLRGRFPRASDDFIKLNSGKLQPAKLEQNDGNALERVAKGKEKSQLRSPDRIRLRYRIFRVRLQDEDNAIGGTKAITDSLKFCGLIPDDCPDKISITVEQERVKSFNEERTEITVEYPNKQTETK